MRIIILKPGPDKTAYVANFFIYKNDPMHCVLRNFVFFVYHIFKNVT